MIVAVCRCGHDKQDHGKALKEAAHGPCKVCLCDKYEKAAAAAPLPFPTPTPDGSSRLR